MKKKTIIESLNKTNYSKEEVIQLMNKLGYEKSTPNKLKFGDVFIDFVGVKKRPCVIIKVIYEFGIVVSFPLSGTESPMNLIPYSSRFHDDGFINNQLLTTPIEIAHEYFVGVFDNDKVLKRALKLHNKFYNSKIKTKPIAK